MLKKMKIPTAALALFTIGSYVNSSFATEQRINETLINSDQNLGPKNFYLGPKNFMYKFESGQYKDIGQNFYTDIKENQNAFEKYKQHYIFENNIPHELQSFQIESLRSYLLDLIKNGELIPTAIVCSGEITPPCPGYYCIPGIETNRDASDVYYVKTSEVEQALQR